MTEDKAVKAIRKVIINLIPEEYAGKPIPEGVVVPIDISDKLENGKYYYLGDIQATYKTHKTSISYVTFREYEQFKSEVEDILDATIVNAKQRESMQKLLERAFYKGVGFGGAVI